MKPTFVHCLFEQSGVFKNAFRQLSIPALDYDFVGFEPGKGQSLAKIRKMQYIEDCQSSPVSGMCSAERSMISPEYAHNFICDFILNEPSGNNVPTLFD